MNISSLNEDCLIQIFQYLKVEERMRVEGVCKQWGNIIRYYDITSLHVDKITWPENTNDNERKALHLCLKIMERCGPFLKEFSYSWKKFSPIAFKRIIPVLCPNLERFSWKNAENPECIPLFHQWKNLRRLELHFSIRRPLKSMIINAEEVENLVNLHLHLEEIVIHAVSDVYFKPRYPAFTNPRLKKLEIDLLFVYDENDEVKMHMHKLPLAALSMNCPKLVSLKLYYYCCLNVIEDISAIGNLPKLQELTLSCYSFPTDCLPVICKNCPEICLLEIDVRGCWPSVLDFRPLKYLKKLTHLVIKSKTFHDEELIGVSQNSQLKEVMIPFSSVTDQGVGFLSKSCQKLTHLDVSCCYTVTNSSLVRVVKNCRDLRYLSVSYTKASNELMKAVGELSKKLEFLTVRGCNQINQAGMKLLLQARKPRMFAFSLPKLTIKKGIYSPLINMQGLSEDMEVCNVCFDQF